MNPFGTRCEATLGRTMLGGIWMARGLWPKVQPDRGAGDAIAMVGDQHL